MFKPMRFVVPMLAAIALFVGVTASPALADEPKAGGAINGTVVDKDGKALPNVAVKLYKAEALPQKPAKEGRPGKANKAAGAGAAIQAPDVGKADKVAKAEKPGKAGKGGANLPAALKDTTTDADGKFTFAGVEPGDYAVLAMAKGVGNGRGKVTKVEGTDAAVTITLQNKPARQDGQAQKPRKADKIAK